MNRIKVTPAQVESYLKANNRPVPRAEMAAVFGCTTATITARMRDLRGEGRPALPTRQGYIYAEYVESQKKARLVLGVGKWSRSVIGAVAEIYQTAKEPLKLAGHTLKLPAEKRAAFESARLADRLGRMTEIINTRYRLTK